MKKRTDRPDPIALLVCGAFLLLAIVLLYVVVPARKAAYERVLGREISWWDYWLISKR